ncbi:glycosyltransferase [Rouxiella badensis]|uniref:glycosyltransferase n=1 Tax=Rouxiella badensis TaxID=1646377 RepID=UPI001D1371C9|nr:glycosyltransferase [Rouxiella badensis]MCC3733298.1 glycosyltransferase [Rouxiella badensis]MCC3758051.1 glycosyltransferase [Rouxiella badensis]WAT08722.1 glycosyltransferase [Rouxiella badensis]
MNKNDNTAGAEMFSVLISLYNKEKPEYLYECLESLDKQILKPDETVIFYDGFISKELDDVVNEFLVSLNIQKVISKDNIGLGLALSEGLKFCSHNIVARMDTDDICINTRFSKQIPMFKQDKNLALLGSAVEEFDEKGETRIKMLPLDYESIKKYALMKNPFNHMSVIFRKDKILEVGGYSHHLYMEDYNLWLRLIEVGESLKNIPDVLLRVRVNSDMVKRRKGLVYIKSEIQLLRLKLKLKIHTPSSSIASFVVRSVPRVLPTNLLSALYKIDRS